MGRREILVLPRRPPVNPSLSPGRRIKDRTCLRKVGSFAHVRLNGETLL